VVVRRLADWHHGDSGDVLFQAKAYMNGNMHFRFLPDAIKALNVEAGRLLGWLRSAATSRRNSATAQRTRSGSTSAPNDWTCPA
jgi:hypothetical protein